MIFGKLWHALKAQLNKIANVFWTADPIATMQYEYDLAVAQLKEGRVGLEQYQALVMRVGRQVDDNKRTISQLEAKIKAYLQAGDRESAAKLALQLQKARTELSENDGQLKMHETAYQNNLAKIKHASEKLAEIQTKIKEYDADLKMSKAEAEIAELANSFHFNVTTDFGQIEQVLKDKIDANRAKAKVAADMSDEGMVDLQREQAMEKQLGDQALRDFEASLGMVTPETADVKPTEKELGPAQPMVEAQASGG